MSPPGKRRGRPDDLENPYTIADAQADLDKSVQGLTNFIDGAVSLWRHQGWKLLGFEDWDALCAKEYQYKIRDRIARLEAVEAMTNTGMSTPAIAAAVGYGQSTIARDVRDLTHLGRVTPDRVTVGLNDQGYPQGQDRAEQVLQLAKDREPNPPRQRPSCEIGEERIDRNLGRIHRAMNDLDREVDVTAHFVDHLNEIVDHATRVRSHYDERGNRIAPWPDGSTLGVRAPVAQVAQVAQVSPMNEENPVRWAAPRDANSEAYMALQRQYRGEGYISGMQSRWLPDREKPQDPTGWGVSTHTLMRTEAWSAVTADETADQVEAVLAALPGVIEHGHVHHGEEKDRRPYGWVVRRQDGSREFCTHTRERWTSGHDG